MSCKKVRELKEEGIFIGSDFMTDAKNKSHIDIIGKRKYFSANSKGILLSKSKKEWKRSLISND